MVLPSLRARRLCDLCVNASLRATGTSSTRRNDALPPTANLSCGWHYGINAEIAETQRSPGSSARGQVPRSQDHTCARRRVLSDAAISVRPALTASAERGSAERGWAERGSAERGVAERGSAERGGRTGLGGAGRRRAGRRRMGGDWRVRHGCVRFVHFLALRRSRHAAGRARAGCRLAGRRCPPRTGW